MTKTLTKPKERPILFKTPMVQAIFGDLKAVTRRLPTGPTELCVNLDEPYPYAFRDRKGLWHTYKTLTELIERRSPYGKPGDILWLRETWRPRSWGNEFEWMCVEYRADQGTERESFKLDVKPEECWPDFLRLESTWERLSQECIDAGCPRQGDGFILAGEDGMFPIKWRPSIFMPRAACRLLLRVKDVRVERLQDITEAQAISEGINQFSEGYAGLNYDLGKGQLTREPIQAFRWLWDKINGPRGYGWDTNPWLWVVEFERVDTAIKEATS
ncbi:MAG: hypothetical protein AAGE59_32390 [Cyanobacteria bacterium P01_F01_bin.86]